MEDLSEILKKMVENEIKSSSKWKTIVDAQ